jgi:hypothetical protein
MKLIIGIIILVVVLVLFLAWYTDKLYIQLDNNNDIDRAREYLRYRRFVPNTPLDHYRMGNVFNFVLRDHAAAQRHYQEALLGLENAADANFIVDRLTDIYVLPRELDEIPFHFDFNLDELVAVDVEPEMKWVSDSQNVHDTSITDEIRRQYEHIKEQNQGYYLWSLDDIRNYIMNVFSSRDTIENEYKSDACQMITYIQNQYDKSIVKISDTEDRFISHVFTRIYNSGSPAMMENFVMNLKDAYADGTPVCITGRISRVISSFAGFEDLGVLKSRQVLKHEIYGKAASIRSRLLSAAPLDEQKKYDNGEETLVEKQIKQEIEDMVDTYLPVTNEKFVSSMKANAVAAV